MALRASHLMLGLMHQDLEILVPLGVQVVVDDLAPRHVRLPHSHSAHAYISISDTRFCVLHIGFIRLCTGLIPFH